MKNTLLVATFCVTLSAQTPPSLNFEVASIRLIRPARPEPGTSIQIVRVTPNSVALHAVPLDFCIAWAYKVQPYQITGAHVPQDVYEITAKASGPATREDLRLMLRSLLADRFHLALHRDSKEMRIYALVQGSNVRLEPADSDEEMAVVNPSRGGMPRLDHVTMFDLAMMLSDVMDTPVADMTELTGRFNIKLDPSRYMNGEPVSRNGVEGRRAAFVSAVQDQLGLKLESRKIPVDVLVVEHFEKPSEN